MTPRPPGVIGMTAAMLAKPNATSSPTRLGAAPNARMNTNSDAASSNQFMTAQVDARITRSRSWAISRSRAASCRIIAAIRSASTNGTRRVSLCSTRSAPASPRTIANPRDTTNTIRINPKIAPVTYAGRNPYNGMDTNSASKKMTLSATAEISPVAASANPASLPATPLVVSSRYPRAAPAALPPGTTLLSDLVAS